MKLEEYIESVIRPKIQGDGGEVRFQAYTDGKLTLVFQGECSKCLILDRCLRWIESEVQKDLGMTVNVCAVRKTPYFWDK